MSSSTWMFCLLSSLSLEFGVLTDEMKHAMLKQLNNGKTEFLLIASPYLRKTITTTHLNIGNDNVPSSTSARNLGMVFDQHINFEKHINNIRRSCFQHLKRISDIRKCITEDAAKQLVHAFITSRLDNGNYLLYGLPTSTISHLQKIQNSAARLITRTRKFDFITLVLRNLHWLPIEKRIIFKINVLTFRAMHGTAPQYLADLLRIHTPSRILRSSSKTLLSVVRPRLDSYGSRAFSVADPLLWNELPYYITGEQTLTSFITKLKTHIFSEAYPQRQ